MLNYRKISKEVGHNGDRLYPTLTEAKSLLENLKNSPALEDYKEALRYYRFLPVAHSQEEVEIIHTINTALVEGKKNLGIEEPKLTFHPTVKHFDSGLKRMFTMVNMKWRTR